MSFVEVRDSSGHISPEPILNELFMRATLVGATGITEIHLCLVQLRFHLKLGRYALIAGEAAAETAIRREFH